MVVEPVPPLATANVPAKTIDPVVGTLGVKPVEPPEKLDTAPAAAQLRVEPLYCRVRGVLPEGVRNDVLPEEV